MSEQDKLSEKAKEKASEDDVQDLDLDTEQGEEITERVRGGRLPIS